MIIKEGSEVGLNTLIKHSDGRILNCVKEFNTETKKAIMYATGCYDDKSKRVLAFGESLFDCNRKVVTFECHLLGHKAYNKHTGEEIK